MNSIHSKGTANFQTQCHEWGIQFPFSREPMPEVNQCKRGTGESLTNKETLTMLLAQPPRQYARVRRPPSRSSHGGPPLPPLLSRGRRRRIRRRTTGTAPPADYLADRGARGASGTLTHERQGGGPFDLRVERRAPSAHRLDEASRTGTVASGRHCFAGFFLTAWPVSCPAVVEIARLCSVDSLSASGLFPQLFK